MVLKRLIVTALGALGLGALVSGPASAQEIPAPDLFDGQVACSMNVPTPPASLVGAGMDGMAIGITAKIATGMAIAVNADATEGTDDDFVPHTDDAGLANILYVIDPNLGNCGAGYLMNDAGEFLNAMGDVTTTPDEYVPVAIAEGIAADVGAGYTDTLTKFMAVVGADEDVEAKQATLNGLLEDDIDDDVQTAQITAAREALTTSQGTQTKAHSALYAATGPDRDGSIYRAGVAEWRAKGAVEKAITAWNSAVGEVGTTQTTLNPSSYAKYVPLRDTAQIDALVGADGNVNLVALRRYANFAGDNSAVQDSMTGAITDGPGSTGTTGNFDAAGNLLVPMSVFDHDDDTNTPDALGPTRSALTYAEINTRLTSVNDTVKALEKAKVANTVVFLNEVYDQAISRAKAEQAYYQSQFNAAIADNTDLDTGTDGVQSLKTRYDAYSAAVTKRDNAGVTLETAVQTREAATAAVRAAFTNPQSFYQQLVDRRQHVKDQADAEVERLAALTGDEAPTAKQTEDAAKAAADAKTAVDDAQATLDSFQGLFDDDNPVGDLVRELLKPDDGEGMGDDGQALVDAISGSYDAANAAKTTADEAKTTADQVAEDVAGLTGDDGAVRVNTRNIEANTKSIDGIEAEIWGDARTDGMSRIDANEMRSMTNATNIATNASNIATNAENIVGLRTDVDQNSEDIMTNAGNIMTNSGRITTNEGNISSNADAIANNMNSIGQNASAIGRNSEMITGLQDQMEIVRAGVAASMALAGMPAINGRGISIGVGSFDGESAFAVGFQIQGEMASFKVGVTSSGGETGASAGVGFQF